MLAPGAGAGQTSHFMVEYARGLATRGVDVLTFDFLYIEEGRKLPDRAEVLEACYRAAVDAVGRLAPFESNAVFIGGKSMGGRMASHLAAADDATAAAISGVVLLGYPLHPPGRADKLRVAHLSRIRVPVLVIQGERDAFGTPDELRPHFAALGPQTTIHAVERADHSLTVRGRRPQADPSGAIHDLIVAWIAGILRRS